MKVQLTLAPLGGDLERPLVNATTTFDARRGWLVTALLEGVRGFGEASPLPGYSPDSYEETELALRALGPRVDLEVDTIEHLARSVAAVSERLPTTAHAARFGVEGALFDAYARWRGVPLWGVLRHGLDLSHSGEQVPARLPLATWLQPGDLAEAEACFESGVHTFKLKLGRDLEAELAFAAELRARFPSAGLRFDANRSLPSDELDATLAALAALGAEFVEEPSLSLPSGSPTPLALDESLQGIEPAQVPVSPAVRVWVLKPTALGGLLRTARYVHEALARGVEPLVSHTLEGPIARAILGELALAIGGSAAVGLGDHAGLQALAPTFRVHAQAFGGRAQLAPHHAPGFGHAELDLSIAQAAHEQPQRVALVGPGTELTYEALAARCLERRRALEAQGLRAGDALAFVPGLDVESVVTVLAAIEDGICLVPLHPRATPEEHARVVRESAATWLAEPPQAPCHDEPATPRQPTPTSALAILFTSGTSGSPKGALLPRRAFVASAWASRERLGGGGPDADAAVDRWLLSLTPAHVGGLSIIVRTLVTRGTLVLPAAPDFDAASFSECVARQAVTHLSLVPTMLSRLLGAGFVAPPTLRVVLLGGAAAEPALVARALAAGVPVRTTYGMTEACSQVATQASPGEPGCGRPLTGLEVRAREGVLEVRGATLFSGYLGQREHLDEQGWFRTGDLGRVDEAGFVHVEGRREDLIVSGGENVYPAEVEARLALQPDVLEAAVFGVYDQTWGQRVVAACVLAAPAAGISSDGSVSDVLGRVGAVDGSLAEGLARFKLPKEYWVLPALPRTSLGKIARGRLQALRDDPEVQVVDATRLRGVVPSGR